MGRRIRYGEKEFICRSAQRLGYELFVEMPGWGDLYLGIDIDERAGDNAWWYLVPRDEAPSSPQVSAIQAAEIRQVFKPMTWAGVVKLVEKQMDAAAIKQLAAKL